MDRTNNIFTAKNIMMENSSLGKNVQEVLTTQYDDIQKLKSNVKWIYKYGGTGSGTGGSGTTTNWSIYATLNNEQIKSGNNIIVNGAGQYDIYIKINNPNGGEFKMTMTYTNSSGSISRTKTFNFDQGYSYTYTEILDINDSVLINVVDTNSEEKQVSAKYIIDPYSFSIDLYKNDESRYTSTTGDIFITEAKKDGLNIGVNYNIGISATIDLIASVNNETILDTTSESIKPIVSGKGLYLINVPSSMFDDENKDYTLNCNVVILIKPQDQVQVEQDYTTKANLIPNGIYLSVTKKTDRGLLYYNTEQPVDLPSEQFQFLPGIVPLFLKPYDGYTDKGQTFTYNFTHVWTSESSIVPYDKKEEEQIALKEREITTYNITAADAGWHKISFEEYNTKKSFTYYFYIYKIETNIGWYSDEVKSNIVTQNYYRSRECNISSLQPYISKQYIPLSSNGTSLYGTLSLPTDTGDAKDIKYSIGIQYSYINDTTNPICVFTTNENSTISIYQDKIEYGSSNNTISYLLPKITDDFNSTTMDNYHLIELYVRTKYIDENSNQYKEITLFLDGILEGALKDWQTPSYQPSKFVLNNCNAFINLLEVTYIKSQNGDKELFTSEYDNVLYWYKYKQYVLQDTTITSDQLTLLKQFHDYCKWNIDGTITTTSINGIAKYMDIPILVIKREDKDTTNSWEFINKAWNDTTSNDPRKTKFDVTLKWGTGKTSPEEIPTDIVYENTTINTQFYINLQGSSTLGYRCKNFELSISTKEADADHMPVYSPNFKKDDTTSFLPEQSFTLKADVVDSGHSNNTAIGRFVNNNTTKFKTNSTGVYKNYIKNCLDGFPILLAFEHTPLNGDATTYILGIYNFNLGRNSYFNLGYYNPDDCLPHTNISPSIQEGFNITILKSDDVKLINNLTITEISNGNPYFDFSQFDKTILFPLNTNDDGAMFGDFVFGTTSDTTHQNWIQKFVEKVCRGGAYLFKTIGKQFGPHSEEYHGYYRIYDISTGAKNIEYTAVDAISKNQVPEYEKQYKRVFDGNYTSYNEAGEVKDITINDLYKAILTDETRETDKEAAVDYQSLIEYYTICMAFGLVDSVQKNLNIKSWDGQQFYVAFYDMDTCLGIDNGGQDVAFFAFSDYWQSVGDTIEGNITIPGQITIYHDYYPERIKDSEDPLYEKFGKNLPIGYDIPSSYLFALAKYSKMFETSVISPNDLWATWRNSDGSLKDADYFIDTYYKNHLNKFDEILFNANYRYKYFYANTIDKGNDNTNFTKFNGRRIEKVREWLRGRLHLLDAYFNMNSVDSTIQYINFNDESNPAIEYWDDEKQYIKKVNWSSMANIFDIKPSNVDNSNEDIYILHDIFSASTEGTQYNSGEYVANVQVAEYSPIIVKIPNQTKRYLLTEGNTTYKLSISTTGKQFCLWGGSNQWTSLETINNFVLNNFRCHSSYIKILNGTSGTITSFNLSMPSVNTIYLTSQQYSGSLIVTNDNYPDINKIDLHRSNISLTTSNTNVTYIDVSGTDKLNKASKDTVSIKSSQYLETLYIKYVQITTFDLQSKWKTFIHDSNNASSTGASVDGYGSFTWDDNVNGTTLSNITNLTIIAPSTNSTDKYLIVANDQYLQHLSVTGYNKVVIKNCNNLESVQFGDDAITEFTLINSGSSSANNVYITSNGVSANNGDINLCKLTNLKRLTINQSTKFTKLILPGISGGLNIYNGDIYQTNIKTISIADPDGVILGNNGCTLNGNAYNYSSGSIGPATTDPTYHYGANQVSNYRINLCGSKALYYNSALTLLQTNGLFTPIDIPNTYTDKDGVSQTTTSLSYLVGQTAITLSTFKYIIGRIHSGNNITDISYLAYNCPQLIYNSTLGLTEYSNKCFCMYNTSGIMSEASLFKNLNKVVNANGLFEYSGFTFINRYMFKNGLGSSASTISLSDFVRKYSGWGTGISGAYEGVDISTNTPSKSDISKEEDTTHYYKCISTTIDFLYDILNKVTYFDLYYHRTDKYQFYYCFFDTTGNYISSTLILNNIFYNDSIYPSALRSINGFSTIPCVTTDFSNLFKQNWPYLTSFTNVYANTFNKTYNVTGLSGLFQKLSGLKYLNNSFIVNNVATDSTNKVIDLYELFNEKYWSSNTSYLQTNVLNNEYYPCLTFKKYVEYSSYKKILQKIYNNTALNNISYLFYNTILYAPITDINRLSISTFDDTTLPENKNITNIAGLFRDFVLVYSEYGIKKDNQNESKVAFIPLDENFFKLLPNIKIAYETFRNFNFRYCLPFNFWNKLSVTSEKNKYYSLSSNSSTYYIGDVYHYTYNESISDLRYCFYGASWFNNNNNNYDETVNINPTVSPFATYFTPNYNTLNISSNTDSLVILDKDTSLGYSHIKLKSKYNVSTYVDNNVVYNTISQEDIVDNIYEYDYFSSISNTFTNNRKSGTWKYKDGTYSPDGKLNNKCVDYILDTSIYYKNNKLIDQTSTYYTSYIDSSVQCIYGIQDVSCLKYYINGSPILDKDVSTILKDYLDSSTEESPSYDILSLQTDRPLHNCDSDEINWINNNLLYWFWIDSSMSDDSPLINKSTGVPIISDYHGYTSDDLTKKSRLLEYIEENQDRTSNIYLIATNDSKSYDNLSTDVLKTLIQKFDKHYNYICLTNMYEYKYSHIYDSTKLYELVEASYNFYSNTVIDYQYEPAYYSYHLTDGFLYPSIENNEIVTSAHTISDFTTSINFSHTYEKTISGETSTITSNGLIYNGTIRNNINDLNNNENSIFIKENLQNDIINKFLIAPDLFKGCSSACKISNVFNEYRNSYTNQSTIPTEYHNNLMGIMPKKLFSSIISTDSAQNIFKHAFIMPQYNYYYKTYSFEIDSTVQEENIPDLLKYKFNAVPGSKISYIVEGYQLSDNNIHHIIDEISYETSTKTITEYNVDFSFKDIEGLILNNYTETYEFIYTFIPDGEDITKTFINTTNLDYAFNFILSIPSISNNNKTYEDKQLYIYTRYTILSKYSIKNNISSMQYALPNNELLQKYSGATTGNVCSLINNDYQLLLWDASPDIRLSVFHNYGGDQYSGINDAPVFGFPISTKLNRYNNLIEWQLSTYLNGYVFNNDFYWSSVNTNNTPNSGYIISVNGPYTSKNIKYPKAGSSLIKDNKYILRNIQGNTGWTSYWSDVNINDSNNQLQYYKDYLNRPSTVGTWTYKE